MMAHLAAISADFVGEIRGCTFLYSKAREPFALLRGRGHEVSCDPTFGRVFRILPERWAHKLPTTPSHRRVQEGAA
jgi:hypothetical protein